VIEEILHLKVSPDYFSHLRNRIVTFTPASSLDLPPCPHAFTPAAWMMLPLPSISTSVRLRRADDEERHRVSRSVLKVANSSAALLGNFWRAPKLHCACEFPRAEWGSAQPDPGRLDLPRPHGTS
jgi:hypothetical protein